MKKHELITVLAATTGKPKATVAAVLNALPELAAKQLATGGKFVVPGVVTLTLKDTPERTYRNPNTGVAIIKPAGKRVHAKAANGLH